jgi:predicted RNA binding protein YcfA (HicA-like mRNA interferase family)
MIRRGGYSAMMPRHPSKEIAAGTLNAILKQLGLKGK